jgi:hypothetical protein
MLYVVAVQAGAPAAVRQAADAVFDTRPLHEIVPGVAYLLQAAAGGEAFEYDTLRERLRAVARQHPGQLSFSLSLVDPSDVDWETAGVTTLADGGR